MFNLMENEKEINMKTFYTMDKSGWNAKLGDYSATEIQTGPLTLSAVQARVTRLPDTTDWLWTIDKRRGDPNGYSEVIGSVSADMFDGDVMEDRNGHL